MKALKFDTRGNREVNEAIQRLLFALGYRWFPGRKEIMMTEARYLFANEDGGLTWSYGDDQSYFLDRHGERVEWVEQIGTWVRLSDEYTAEVQDGKVTVGCQSFDFDEVERLYEAVKRERDNG